MGFSIFFFVTVFYSFKNKVNDKSKRSLNYSNDCCCTLLVFNLFI